MQQKETKSKHVTRNTKHVTALVKIAVILITLLGLANTSFAVNDYSSTNFTVKAPVIDTGFGSSTSSNFGLGQSLTQTAIGKSTSTNFQLWSGFQYFFKVSANTLTPTAGDGQVSLSWTVPATYLGISVASYEVGTGTISGSYTFQNVGNVTSFIKSGLTNGTQYYFIVKAISAGNNFLVFSNEAASTPVAGSGGGGGGGGGGSSTGINISGNTFPNASITVVKDSVNFSDITADGSGHFQIGIFSLTPGSYNFILYATDGSGARTASISFSATISNGVVTTVSNLLLAPTLAADLSIVKQGNTITLTGYAAPNVPVNLTITSATVNKNASVISNGLGKFTYSLDTTGMAKENYIAKATYVFAGITSPVSLPVTFVIGERDVPAVTGCGRSDLNCDGKVDLIDFSILLYYWDSTSFAANPRVDINQSGRVDLADFSIMLYDWTGK